MAADGIPVSIKKIDIILIREGGLPAMTQRDFDSNSLVLLDELHRCGFELVKPLIALKTDITYSAKYGECSLRVNVYCLSDMVFLMLLVPKGDMYKPYLLGKASGKRIIKWDFDFHSIFLNAIDI